MVVPAQRLAVHECPHESEHQGGGRDQIAEGAPKRLPRGWKLPLPVAHLEAEKQQPGGSTGQRREGSKISGDEEDRDEGQDSEIEGQKRNTSQTGGRAAPGEEPDGGPSATPRAPRANREQSLRAWLPRSVIPRLQELLARVPAFAARTPSHQCRADLEAGPRPFP